MDYKIEITRKNIKNINLRVSPPNGDISVSIPLNTSEKEARDFIKSKEKWIEKAIKRVQDKSTIKETKFDNGEKIYIFGKLYTFQVIITGVDRVNLTTDKLILYTNALVHRRFIAEQTKKALITHTIEEKDKEYYQNIIEQTIRKNLVNEWLDKLLIEKMDHLLLKWQIRMKLRCTHWELKDIKTYWGKCNTRTGKILFNRNLSSKSIECIEYVIVHELAHLKEANHGPRFWALVESYVPNAKQIRVQLNNND